MSSHSLYMPQVFGPTESPVGQGQLCGMNAYEQMIFDLMRTHPEQGRVGMVCHPLLCRVARAKATGMAERNYFGHIDLNGYGPNWAVRQAGYALPDFYDNADDGNNIESLSAGDVVPEEAWSGWMDSTAHRKHLVAEYAFYREQTQIGVGYAFRSGSKYGHYYCVISAPLE